MVMKCPKCGEGWGFRNALSTAPGKPFPCGSCGVALKIDTKRAGLVAAAALLLGLAPLTGIVPPALGLFWVILMVVGALLAYLSLAMPYDPDAALSFRARGGKFELLPEGIRYGGKLYSYADVLHLSRYARKTSINFLPVEDFLRIRVHLKGEPEPVTLQNSFGLILTTSGLKEIYQRLVETTFTGRIRRYLSQIERTGYFDYGGARFHRDGGIAIGETKLDLRTAKISMEPFKLVINPPGLFNRKRRVDTEMDYDVLLSLLKEIYGITFKS